MSTRKTLYWLFSGGATVFYLLICGALMTVPGVEPITKLVLLSFAAFSLMLPLMIGIWNIAGTEEAPITIRPLGPVVWVFVMLQFLNCLIQIAFQVKEVIRGR